MCFTRIYGFILCDPKVINSSLNEKVAFGGPDVKGVTVQIPTTGRKQVVWYTTDTPTNGYTLSFDDSGTIELQKFVNSVYSTLWSGSLKTIARKVELYYNTETILTTSNSLANSGSLLDDLSLDKFSGSLYTAMIKSSTYTHVLYGQNVGNQLRFCGVNMPASGTPTPYGVRVSYNETTFKVTSIEYVNKPTDVIGIIGLMYYKIF